MSDIYDNARFHVEDLTSRVIENKVRLDLGTAHQLHTESFELLDVALQKRREGDAVEAIRGMLSAVEVGYQAKDAFQQAKTARQNSFRVGRPIESDLEDLLWKTESLVYNLILSTYHLLEETYSDQRDYTEQKKVCTAGIALFQEVERPEASHYYHVGCLCQDIDEDQPTYSDQYGRQAINFLEECIRRMGKPETNSDLREVMSSYYRLGQLYQCKNLNLRSIEKAYSAFLKAQEYGAPCDDVLSRFKKSMFGKIKFMD